MTSPDWPPPRRRAQDPDFVAVLDRLRAGDRLLEHGPGWHEFAHPPHRVAPFRVRALRDRGFLSEAGGLTHLGRALLAVYDGLARGDAA